MQGGDRGQAMANHAHVTRNEKPLSPEADPRLRCPGCRAVFNEEQWEKLELNEVLSAAEVGRLIRGWRDDECIEVRKCRTCAKSVAARRPSAGRGTSANPR